MARTTLESSAVISVASLLRLSEDASHTSGKPSILPTFSDPRCSAKGRDGGADPRPQRESAALVGGEHRGGVVSRKVPQESACGPRTPQIITIQNIICDIDPRRRIREKGYLKLSEFYDLSDSVSDSNSTSARSDALPARHLHHYTRAKESKRALNCHGAAKLRGGSQRTGPRRQAQR